MAYFEKGFHVSKDDTKILNLLKPRSGVVRAILDTDTYNAVSYTHLTLPTILLV